MIAPLVFVRVDTVYRVPDVYCGYWTADDWRKVSRRVCEPLVIDALGFTWLATGNRDTNGRLLYRSVICPKPECTQA